MKPPLAVSCHLDATPDALKGASATKCQSDTKTPKNGLSANCYGKSVKIARLNTSGHGGTVHAPVTRTVPAADPQVRNPENGGDGDISERRGHSARDENHQRSKAMTDTATNEPTKPSGSDAPTCSASSRPTLLDAKWLDPECWDGCQSLRWKNALTRIATEFEHLNGMECNHHCGQCIKCIASDALSDPQNAGAVAPPPQMPDSTNDAPGG